MADPGSPTGVATADAVTVAVSDQQRDVEIDADRWAALAAAVAVAEGGEGELTLTFVDRDEMADLNREHMGGDGATDVLSFPLDATAIGDPTVSPADVGPTLLGDIVVCPAVAHAQVPKHAGTLDDELALLVVHGCLHVFGHDHAEPAEGELMRARELELLAEHHWRGPAPTGFRQEHE